MYRHTVQVSLEVRDQKLLLLNSCFNNKIIQPPRHHIPFSQLNLKRSNRCLTFLREAESTLIITIPLDGCPYIIAEPQGTISKSGKTKRSSSPLTITLTGPREQAFIAASNTCTASSVTCPAGL